jgi:Mce-associated membrane protein
MRRGPAGDNDATMPPNPATLGDVKADPTPDEEAESTPDATPGADGATLQPPRLESSLSERTAPVVPEGTKRSSDESAPASKTKKKSKKQVELRAEIRGLEAQIRDLEAQPGRDRRHGRRRLIVPVLAGVVIVILAVGLVLTSLRVRQADTTSSARTSAVATAKTYAVDLSSYDYRHLAVDFGIVTAHSTPTFAKTFIQQSDALKPVLTKYKATAKATVDAAGLTSGSARRAVVLVIVSQTVSNTVQKKGPTTQRSQVSLTLVRQHGHWLIDNAQLL